MYLRYVTGKTQVPLHALPYSVSRFLVKCLVFKDGFGIIGEELHAAQREGQKFAFPTVRYNILPIMVVVFPVPAPAVLIALAKRQIKRRIHIRTRDFTAVRTD